VYKFFYFPFENRPTKICIQKNVKGKFSEISQLFYVHLWEVAEDLVALGVEDHKALIKVVVLHGGGGVEGGQAVARLDLHAQEEIVIRKGGQNWLQKISQTF